MTKFLMVDVASVTSSIPRSNFQEADLDILADKILESGGILKPLVLKKTGFEKYEVVDGHFEYHAAVRAREKNPSDAEMVNALIISSEKEKAVLNQAAVLKDVNQPDQLSKTTEETIKTESSRLANLELRLEKQLNELKSEITQERYRIENKFKELENRIPQRLEPLNLLNSLDKEQLYLRLQRSRISKAEKLAKDIVDVRRKKPKQEFEDYRDVVKSVNGLGDKTILVIIDEWSRS